MAKTLQFRRLSTVALANTVGANGELIVDSSNGTISVHDGRVSGGKRLATETYVVNTANQLITAAVPTRLGQLTNDFGYITSSASISGGSATAIRLFTPRYINGVAFDGTANITISTANANVTVTVTESLAQSAFAQANTASNTASSSQANTIILQGVNTTQNTRITVAEGVNTTQNTNITNATNLAQAAFNTANTANTRTVINGLGNSKLDFTTYGANTAYLTTTNDDSTALFMGVASTELYAYTNVQIRANTAGISQNWTFGADGTLTFPNSSIQNTAFTGTAIDQVARNSANAAAQTVPQNAQSTNYVLQLTDAGKHIYYTQASNTILYIPTTSNVAFSNGTTIMIVSRTSSSANVTISPNTGVTMYLAGNTTSASRNVTTYGMATLIQVAANTWFINGTGVA